MTGEDNRRGRKQRLEPNREKKQRTKKRAFTPKNCSGSVAVLLAMIGRLPPFQ